MNTETVKIADLQVGDEILDSEELALSVKNIEQRGASFRVTVNYTESGFYQDRDSTFTHRGTTRVRRIVAPISL